MSLLPVPSSETVLTDIAPLIPAFYTAYELGALKALDFFARERREINATYYNETVRYYAREHLISQSDTLNYEMPRLPSNGVEVRFGRYHIKIFKACSPFIAPEQPAVPPAKTLARRRFYDNGGASQPMLPFMEHEMRRLNLDVIDLVLLWSPDATTHNLDVPMILVCPRGNIMRPVADGSFSVAGVDYYWYEPVAHPALTHPVSPDDDSPPDGDDQGRRDDLAIGPVLSDESELGHAT